MQLDSIKVRTAHHTSDLIYRLNDRGLKNVILGNTGLGIAIDPNQVEDLDQHGYIQINNQVVSLPAIPVVCLGKILVVSTTVGTTAFLDNIPKSKEALHILNAVATNKVVIPSIVIVDMSKYMVPLITDSAGKTYMSTPEHKVLYANNTIEAQATIMQVSKPLPEELLDNARRFIRASISPSDPNKEDYYIYLKDRFEHVF